jgi:hypothetical protein
VIGGAAIDFVKISELLFNQNAISTILAFDKAKALRRRRGCKNGKSTQPLFV